MRNSDMDFNYADFSPDQFESDNFDEFLAGYLLDTQNLSLMYLFRNVQYSWQPGSFIKCHQILGHGYVIYFR